MKIKQTILDQVNNPKARTKIAMAINQGEQSIWLLMKDNKPNSSLTKYAALRVISEEVGVAIEDILEPVIELEKA
ncbi:MULTISPECIES: hypothetical protein [unclassified Paraflavitalea]|uniref:hypothetical protein n=1 Tax=unclassified Paraflavitalea TaxID=2798305 RepID=UPI003D324EC3